MPRIATNSEKGLPADNVPELLAEIEESTKDFRSLYPEPYGLAPNLYLAVQAAQEIVRLQEIILKAQAFHQDGHSFEEVMAVLQDSER